MRLLITSAALLLAATASQAGSLSGGTSDPAVTKPGMTVVKHPECTGVLVGGCGYCIGGKVYHL